MLTYRSTILLTLAACSMLLPAPLHAQDQPLADTVRGLNLPPALEQELVALFNDPATIQFTGRTRIPPERVIAGDVAVLGGPVTIAGRVQGRVAVINGNLELSEGADISGDVTVVGGTLTGVGLAAVGGDISTYSESLHYRRRGDRIALRGDGESPAGERDGRADFLIATGQSYNRVEGLPVTFGPVIETAGSNPLRVQALAIYRTENGLTLDTDEMGYFVKAEQLLGGRREFRIGATARSVVSPIEEWHLSDLENGLATFLFRRDFRDHFERRGWSVFGQMDPAGLPVSLTAEARFEKHRSRAAGSPWTLFRNADEWRPQPLIAEGDISSVVLSGKLDTRSNPDDPAWGWLARIEVERALDTDLAAPSVIGLGGALPNTAPGAFENYTAAFVDVRRYNRVSPDSRLNFRLVAGGALSDSPLPPQRQHALGGEGSLPGYTLFEFDCGARSQLVQRPAVPDDDGAPGMGEGAVFFPGYGCDRFALLQAEYRGRLRLRFDWDADPWDDDDDDDDGHEWSTGWSASPDWVLFVDAGRGWAVNRPGTQDIAVDLGLGITLGKAGIFAAVPLNGGSGINVFARIGPRF